VVTRDAPRYVPDRGDAVWLAFTPHAGHEQAGRRPALVLSPRAYNERAGLALADQVKSLDWDARQAGFIAALPAPVVTRTLQLLKALL
jgi:mRNA interferase MazF